MGEEVELVGENDLGGTGLLRKESWGLPVQAKLNMKGRHYEGSRRRRRGGQVDAHNQEYYRGDVKKKGRPVVRVDLPAQDPLSGCLSSPKTDSGVASPHPGPGRLVVAS